MKKAVAIILACCMFMLTLSFASNAETGNTVGGSNAELEAAIAAVVDKLDPSVIECLYNPTDDGRVFEISYHGVTKKELITQIKEISYAEEHNTNLGEGKAWVGLPYSSVVTVAALENVDYITLPDESVTVPPADEKIDSYLRTRMAQMNPDDKIGLDIGFSYRAVPVYIGIDPKDCTTTEEMQNRIRVKREKERAYYSAKNAEFIPKIEQRVAQDGITAEGLRYWEDSNHGYVCTTVGEVSLFAAMPEIRFVGFDSIPGDPSHLPTDVPTEAPTEAPTIRPTTPPTIAPTTLPTTPPTEAPTEPKDLYRERLKERYNLSEFDGDLYTYQLMSYQELYYHRDSSGEIDWALIQCYCNIASPVDMSAVVGNRVLHPGTAYYPFDTTFGIYDVKNDKFIDPSWSGKDYLGGKEAYKYDGFVRAFDEIVGGGMGEPIADVDYRGKGRPLGDIDNDFDLSIVDVTMIQRCEAMIAEYPATDVYNVTYDYKGNPHYCSDFNLDGERDIVDATCIQRYLVGMDYPIG